MAREKFLPGVGPAAFTVDGGASGQVTIADTTGFKVKHRVVVKGTALADLPLEVKRVISTTLMLVGPVGDIKERQDLSAYTVAASSNITFPEQVRRAIPLKEIERAIYEEEPTVAHRVIVVDEQGNPTTGSAAAASDVNIAEVLGAPVSPANPLPVQLSDGGINIGTVNAELEVQLSHADNTPDAGDVADSVQIGDGTDILEINTDGSVNTKEVKAASSATSSVASSATNVTILASNASRLGATVYNDSTKTLSLKLGATATATDFTVKLGSGDYYEIPFGYTGIIDGLWDMVNGSARVTELT
jgi:hypothetical protein